MLLLLLLLHQNFWMWGDSTFVGGLPANLAYHLGLCLAATVAGAVLVGRAWPEYPDQD